MRTGLLNARIKSGVGAVKSIEAKRADYVCCVD
jgi:hypothetical protein